MPTFLCMGYFLGTGGGTKLGFTWKCFILTLEKVDLIPNSTCTNICFRSWVAKQKHQLDKIQYSSAHNHGGGKLLYLKGNYYWRGPFLTSMIMGGSVQHLKMQIRVVIPCKTPRQNIPPGKDRWRNATPISLGLSWPLTKNPSNLGVALPHLLSQCCITIGLQPFPRDPGSPCQMMMSKGWKKITSKTQCI